MLENHCPRLCKTSMLNLDKCKTLYLKAVLGLSNHTSNTFVLQLTKQRSVCEDLRELDYTFEEKAWEEYEKEREAKKAEHHLQNLSDGPAFRGEGWKGANRTDRQRICRLTYHGYHHKICTKEDFFSDSDDACTCKYCGEQRIPRLHLVNCVYFVNDSLSGRVKRILNDCQSMTDK